MKNYVARCRTRPTPTPRKSLRFYVIYTADDITMYFVFPIPASFEKRNPFKEHIIAHNIQRLLEGIYDDWRTDEDICNE